MQAPECLYTQLVLKYETTTNHDVASEENGLIIFGARTSVFHSELPDSSWRPVTSHSQK